MKKFGALPSQMLREMMEGGFIKNAVSDGVNPGSLDLALSEEVYRVEGVFLPEPGETVRELLGKITRTPHEYAKPLERDVTYLARLKEIFALPAEVYGYCNPKSSTGRNDVHVRVLTDGVSRYDVVPAGYRGEAWLVINPKSFSIVVAPGERLVQVRLFNGDTRFNELELEMTMQKEPLLFDTHGVPIGYDRLKIKDGDGSIILRLDTEIHPVGYACFGSDRVLDFSKKDFYAPRDFFNEVKKEHEYVRLKKGVFYILSSREAVRVPPYLACEMRPMDERSGEFRSHYAGFIDPGWGYGKDGEGKGRPLTLEVRPFEDIIVRPRQVIAKIRFERMMDVPDMLYDAAGKSNYVAQSKAKLSKHFVSE